MTLFIICFVIGLVFLIATTVMGGLMDSGGHFHFDLGHGADAGGAGGFHGFSPISPTYISFVLTLFGGIGGICMSMWGIGLGWSVAIALVSSLGMSVVLFLAIAKVFTATEGGVEVNVADLTGREAEVITSIPAKGAGEVAFVTAGGRMNGPARSVDGKPIELGTSVVIQKIVGGTYFVARKSE